MKVELIENGRFKQAIWIDTEPKDYLTEYPHSKALPVLTAFELWRGLTKSLIDAGQGGLIDAAFRECMASNPFVKV